jgi:hypothetical protein
MSQPPGFAHPSFPTRVCKLNKASYGLKQALKAWFSKLGNKLLELGFIGSKGISSLFTFKCSLVTIFILIYIDDIINTTYMPFAIDDLLQQLWHEFVIKYLGLLSFFLGMEVLHLQSGLLLSQRGYILDLSKCTNLMEAKPISSPMSSSLHLIYF